MSMMLWQFQLDDRGVVQLHASGEASNGVAYDLSEQVRPRNNFCGVKYAQLRDAGVGTLDVSWLRYVKWREAYR